MHPTPDVPQIDTTLFHSRVGGFPLFFCTYTLLDADSNPTDDLRQVVINPCDCPQRRALPPPPPR
jgi:hypothetical protein